MKRKFSILALCLALGATAMAADYQLIANPDCGVASLSKDEAKNVLLGTQSKWANGSIIRLAVLSGGPTHEKVVAELTSRTSDQFDKYWKKVVFTGKGVMPVSMSDDAAMVAYVAKTAGAFGYVSAAAPTTGTKVLAVQ